MERVRIKVEGTAGAKLEGHTVEVRYPPAARDVREHYPRTLTRVRASGATAEARLAVAPVREDAEVEVIVTAPSGERVHREFVAFPRLRSGMSIRLNVPSRAPIPSLQLHRETTRRTSGWVLDERTNLPVGGAQISVFARGTDGADRMLFTTTSSADGHFFGRHAEAPVESAWAVVGGHPQPVPLRVLDTALDPRQFVLVDSRGIGKADCSKLGAPRVAGREDLAESPTSFSADVDPSSCVDFRSKPDRTLQETRFTAAIRTSQPSLLELDDGLTSTEAESNGRRRLTTRALDWERAPQRYQATTASLGHLLHYKQSWHADGYSLGDLVHSLPLAPCQMKRVAVLDWDRRERSRRDEDLVVSEELLAELVRDRDIREALATLLTQRMDAGSVATNATGSVTAGAFVGPLFLGASGGMSSSSSSTWQNSARRLGSEYSNRLQDRTMQAQSVLRSLRSTVVQTLGENEQVEATTEVVGNHNHCHALTVQYFEVLRHFVIRQELEAVEECLFVPLRVIHPEWGENFFRDGFRPPTEDHLEELAFRTGLRRLLRYRDALIPALRAKGYYDAEATITAAERVQRQMQDRIAIADMPISWIEGTIGVEFSLARPKAESEDAWLETILNVLPEGDHDLQEGWKLLTELRKALGTAQTEGLTIDTSEDVDVRAELMRMYRESLAAWERKFEDEITPVIIQRFLETLVLSVKVGDHSVDLQASFSPVSSYERGEPLRVAVAIGKNLQADPELEGATRKTLGTLTIHSRSARAVVPAGSQVTLRWSSFGYRTREAAHAGLMPLASGGHLPLATINDQGAQTRPVAQLVPRPITQREARDPDEPDLNAARDLLDHIASDLTYYHHAIWSALDDDERYMILDSIEAPNAGGRSVAQVTRNEVLGIVGNALVLPVAPGVQLDPDLEFENPDDALEELRGHYAPITPPPPMRFTVPTKGVFAEAVMGHCNACEKKDEARFWRWNESPCPDEPTPIQPLDTTSRRAAPPNLTPSPLPAPIVQIQNAPDAPAPTGIAPGVAAIMRGDAFTDRTGLAATQQASASALNASLGASENAARIAATLAQSQHASENLDKLMAAIDSAEADGRISTGRAQELRGQLLDSAVASGGRDLLPSETLPADLGSEAVDTAIEDERGAEVAYMGQDGQVVTASFEPVGPRQPDDEQDDFESLGTSTSTLQVFDLPDDAKLVLLVAGFEYGGPKNPYGSTYWYHRAAQSRARVLTDGGPFESDPSVVFMLFNVGAGTVHIRTAENGVWDIKKPSVDPAAGGGKDDWPVYDELVFATGVRVSLIFDEIDVDDMMVRKKDIDPDSDSDAYLFLPDAGLDVMSITDVYEFVALVGQNQPGSIHELGFHSHGYRYGPVLVNSYTDNASPTRSPNDKDGRAWQDFNDPMPDHQAAFAAGAEVWLWGCSDYKSMRSELLSDVLADPSYKGDGSTPLDTVLGIDVDKTWVLDNIGGYTSKLDVTTSEWTLQEVVDVVLFYTDTSYCGRIAKAFGVTCMGTPPGIESRLNPEDPDFPRLHSVPRGETDPEDGEKNPNYGRYIDFTVNYAGLEEETSTHNLGPNGKGRGYVKHEP
ncbi:MAG: hypothetical protein RIT81_38655 [Deltaproteobacteria bacterium]